MLQLVVATKNDLNTVAELAKIIWNTHYVSIIGQLQVDYMLGKIYNYDSLIEQVDVKNHQFYLIKEEQLVIGFLSISSDNDSDFFLHKLYIIAENSQKGTGTSILNKLQNILQPKSITLTVNRQNFKSINFYFKNGFKIKSVEDFDIENGYEMNDFVMVKHFN
jgi:ribosomal protein S18 acetylase RimI-like enzyme